MTEVEYGRALARLEVLFATPPALFPGEREAEFNTLTRAVAVYEAKTPME